MKAWAKRTGEALLGWVITAVVVYAALLALATAYDREPDYPRHDITRTDR